MEISKRQRVSMNGAAPLYQKLAAADVEDAVLGAVLLDPSLYPSIAEILQPADFFLLFNGYVWYAFDQLAARNEAIDVLTVANELDKRRELAGTDLEGRLSAVMGKCPDPNNAETYAHTVREAATKIRIFNAAHQMQTAMLERLDVSLDELVDECNRLLFAATDQQAPNNDTSMKAIIAKYFGIVDDGLQNKIVPGVPTGFRSIDHLLKNLARKEVVVVAGAEGMGKTSLLLSILRNVSKVFGMTTAMFTLEMTQDEITRILMAMETGIPKDQLKAFDLSEIEWRQFVSAAAQLESWPMHVIDEYPMLTPIQLRRRLRKLMSQEHIDLVVVDGLWLMEPTDAEKDRPRAVSVIMRDLNKIARDFDVPILIAHQYNGEAHKRQDKRPMMFDLAESAGVRRNAQVILGMYRDSYYGITGIQDVTELHILKDRNGRAQGKRVDIGYDYYHACFRELEKRLP